MDGTVDFFLCYEQPFDPAYNGRQFIKRKILCDRSSGQSPGEPASGRSGEELQRTNHVLLSAQTRQTPLCLPPDRRCQAAFGLGDVLTILNGKADSLDMAASPAVDCSRQVTMSITAGSSQNGSY